MENQTIALLYLFGWIIIAIDDTFEGNYPWYLPFLVFVFLAIPMYFSYLAGQDSKTKRG